MLTHLEWCARLDASDLHLDKFWVYPFHPSSIPIQTVAVRLPPFPVQVSARAEVIPPSSMPVDGTTAWVPVIIVLVRGAEWTVVTVRHAAIRAVFSNGARVTAQM